MRSKYLTPKQLSEKVEEESDYFVNVRQEFIQTTADKIKLALIEYKNLLTDKNNWTIPFGPFLALLITILTVEQYHSFWGLSGENWYSIILFGFIVSALWLFISIIRAVSKAKVDEIKFFIGKISKPQKTN